MQSISLPKYTSQWIPARPLNYKTQGFMLRWYSWVQLIGKVVISKQPGGSLKMVINLNDHYLSDCHTICIVTIHHLKGVF